jgi:hypothetical protein
MGDKCYDARCENHDPNQYNHCSIEIDVEYCKQYRHGTIEPTESKLKNKYHEEENNTMNSKHFDVKEKQAQVKGNALNAFDTAKNVVVQMQQGQAVISAVRGAIAKAPGVPQGLKELMASPYGSLITGLILHTTAPILTGNEHIIKAVKAANIAGAVELSNQFTFISDAIEGAIASIPGFDAILDKGADMLGKTDDVEPDADTSGMKDADE